MDLSEALAFKNEIKLHWLRRKNQNQTKDIRLPKHNTKKNPESSGIPSYPERLIEL